MATPILSGEQHGFQMLFHVKSGFHDCVACHPVQGVHRGFDKKKILTILTQYASSAQGLF